MPTLINYSGENEHYPKGPFHSTDSNCSFSVLDLYTRPCKRPRLHDSYTLFSDEETTPSIEILPDECLYEIFRRLSGGQQRSTAACVSKHWLTLLSNLRPFDIVSGHNPSNEEDENNGCLTRSLDGKKATDTRLAAIAVGTSARGGLGKLLIRGSNKVTSIGFSAIASGCPFLRVLSLWNVPSIGDEALISLSKECNSLESIDLCHCESVSDPGLASIVKSSPNLTSLTLETCKNIGNESLKAVARSCPNLQSITIKDCPLIGDQGVASLLSPPSLKLSKVKLQSLTITDFSLAVIGNYGTSISNLALAGLRRVTEKGFWAMGNAKGLRSLVQLSVTACTGVTDRSLETIGDGSRALKHVAVKKCCFLSDNGLISLTKSAKILESLQLEECNRISQRGIVGALSIPNSKLKSFSIVKCMGIKDLEHQPELEPEPEPVPIEFTECRSLHSLTIKNCIGFGDMNLAMVARLCPRLHNLDLTGLRGVTNGGVFKLLETCTPGIVKVNLSECARLTDAVVVELAKIHGGTLEVLNLAGCTKISDESFTAIAENCTMLNDLDVSRCCVTDSGVICLSRGGKMNLKVLSMSGCSKISNESVSGFEKLGKTLRGLNLQSCNLISSSAIESLVVNLWWCDILS